MEITTADVVCTLPITLAVGMYSLTSESSSAMNNWMTGFPAALIIELGVVDTIDKLGGRLLHMYVYPLFGNQTQQAVLLTKRAR